MFSMPPARHSCASPARIECAADTTDWMPEPQMRLTVSAGFSIGTPDFSATWRPP